MPKLGCISSSSVHLLLVNGKSEHGFGLGAVTYAEQIARDIIGVQSEPEYKGYDIERGIENEWLALEAYKERELVQIHGEQQWITHPDYSFYGGTPDGRIGTIGGVDAKCPNNSNHYKNIRHDAQKSEYIVQVSSYMDIARTEWWDIASFNENFPQPLDLHIMRVNRDDVGEWLKKGQTCRVQNIIDEVNERLEPFWKLVLNEVEQMKLIQDKIK
jgi:hypothetical protein